MLSGRRVEELLADERPSRAGAGAARRQAGQAVGARGRQARRRCRRELRPQLATPAARVPEGDDWLHEIKFDGYRTLARIDDGAVRLFTRIGPGLDRPLRRCSPKPSRRCPCKQALIDGEVVVQDESGVASFAALQDALAEGRTHELIFFAFDLLHLDGYDLTAVPLDRAQAGAGGAARAGGRAELGPPAQRARAGQRPRRSSSRPRSSASRA